VLSFVVAAVALAVDLVTKALAVHRLPGRPPVHLVGDLVELTLTRNPGAAFSTGTSLTPVITVVALVAAVVVVVVIWRNRSLGWAWALGLLLAGILGNLVDRLFREPAPFRGHVVDFIALPHWPVFNVADAWINIAAVLIVLLAILGVRLDGTRGTHAGAPGDSGADEESEDHR
jgi:signal peptidase II